MHTHTHMHTHTCTHTHTHTHTHRMGGQLEFWDTGDMTLMNSVEHTMATDLEWDPTGRYVVTSVSYWSQKVKKVFIT